MLVAPVPGKHFHLRAVASKPMLQLFAVGTRGTAVLSSTMLQKRKLTGSVPVFLNLRTCVSFPVFLSTVMHTRAVTFGSVNAGRGSLLPMLPDPSSLVSLEQRVVVWAAQRAAVADTANVVTYQRCLGM